MLFRNAIQNCSYNWTRGLPHLWWRVLACAGAEILDDGYASVLGCVTQTHCRPAVDHVAWNIYNDHGVLSLLQTRRRELDKVVRCSLIGCNKCLRTVLEECFYRGLFGCAASFVA